MTMEEIVELAYLEVKRELAVETGRRFPKRHLIRLLRLQAQAARECPDVDPVPWIQGMFDW